MADRSDMPRSPEVTTINQVRSHLGIVDSRWREVAALLREASASPSYGGPDLERPAVLLDLGYFACRRHNAEQAVHVTILPVPSRLPGRPGR
jgi:hypothetical protein